MPHPTPTRSKIKKKPHKLRVRTKVSLASLLKDRAQPIRRSGRVTRLPTRLGVGATDEELIEADEDIDVLIVPEERDADGDWVISVPGRPSPFRNTWQTAYANRTLYGTLFRVRCGEGCGRDVYMNSSLKEVHSDGSALPGMPRKPPACHVVSWAALQYQLIQMEGAQSRLLGRPSLLRDEFRKAVCWEPSNVGPGHNACNSAGVKTTAQNARASELRAADVVIAKVLNSFVGPVWQ